MTSHRSHTKATLAILLALLAPAPARAGGSDPEVVLDEIFGQVEAMCGGDGQGPPYDLHAIAETYFTLELRNTFERAMASDDLGFDILIDGQDCRIADLELEVVSSDEAGAIGRAAFKNMGDDRVIDLAMSKSADTWKVSDVIYRHRNFSLDAAR